MPFIHRCRVPSIVARHAQVSSPLYCRPSCAGIGCPLLSPVMHRCRFPSIVARHAQAAGALWWRPSCTGGGCPLLAPSCTGGGCPLLGRHLYSYLLNLTSFSQLTNEFVLKIATKYFHDLLSIKLFYNKIYKTIKVKSLLCPGASQWSIYYPWLWGQLSTTSSNMLK